MRAKFDMIMENKSFKNPLLIVENKTLLLDKLEKEIIDNAWLVAPASEQILFDTPYEERYIVANQSLGIHPHNFVMAQVGHS